MADKLGSRRDERGTAVVELTVTFLLFITLVFGVVEFSYAFFQWNSATKAMQAGARYAAVSNPVMKELPDISGIRKVQGKDVVPGSDYAGSYLVVCTGAGSGSCKCTGDECQVISKNTYDSNAMAGIVAAMRKFFPKIKSENVTVTYEYTKLGYAGRPGGPVPTITVSLSGLNFDFILLSAFLSANRVPMPSFATTVTGEDLRATWSAS